MSITTSELIQRARDLAPILAQHASEAERERKPVNAVIEAMREARIFDLMVPRIYGGLEFDLDTYLEVGLALSEGDASMAWVATFYIEHNWMLCQFPEAFQRELYADRSHVLAPASLAPDGYAEPVEGGLRLSGRWKWATGWPHAEWVIAGAQLARDKGRPEVLFFALPRDQVDFEDTWWVDGMRATGSHDILIDDRVVPPERTVSIPAMSEGKAPGAQIHEGPLYRTPMSPILGLAASMPAVGQARAGLARFKEELGARDIYGGSKKHAERPAAQIRLAGLELAVEQAEQLLRQVVGEVMEVRERASPGQRTRWLAATATAVQQSRQILATIAQGSGASAHFESHPLQRAVRDVNTLSCHTVFDLDQRLENYGRTLLGLEPNSLY